MDLYLGVKHFTKVVETESFSVCAREFGLTTSSVTRSVDALEDHLGVTLLHRSTRKVKPTDAGRSYYPKAKRILMDLEEANLEASSLGAKPKGTLRITAPIGLGHIRLSHLLPKFLLKYPEINVELMLTDRYVDLMEESIDVALRAGTLSDSSFKARRLEDYRRVLCASPKYLSKYGTPKTIDDIKNHACLTFDYGPGSRSWYFKVGSKIKEIAVRGPIHVNSLEGLLAAAISGLGITLIPNWSVASSIKSGALVELMPSIKANFIPEFDEALYVLYMGSKPSPKVRAFVDFMVESSASK